MKAAVYYGPNKVEIADVPEPDTRTAAPSSSRWASTASAAPTCTSTTPGPIFVPTEPHPLTHQQMPLVMGHEFSGRHHRRRRRRDRTGHEGDRVAVEPIYKCGHCAPCRAGNYNICQQIGFHGLMSDGGMAEYTVVPTNMLHKLPDNVSLELGALVEPMSVAYHAATLGDAEPR